MTVDPFHVHRTARVGFGSAADSYAATRPAYAPEALAWLDTRCRLRGRSIVDIAAGTGKLTRMLMDFSTDLVAVEPVDGMRRQLEIAVPRVDIRTGLAEQLPLTDECADVVTVAQAFHWFEPAAVEIARVLRPHGWLALLWNVRDLADPLQRAIHEVHMRFRPPGDGDPRWAGVIRRRPVGRADEQPAAAIDASSQFGDVISERFGFVQTLRPEDVVRRSSTVSFIASAEPDVQSAALDAIAQIVDGMDRCDLRFFTSVYVAQRLPGLFERPDAPPSAGE